MEAKRKKTLLITASVAGIALWIAAVFQISSSDATPRPVLVRGTPSSPSGLYVANIEERPHPEYENTVLWVLVIKDASGNVLYEDDQGFVSTWTNSVRWRWDDNEDRVWLFNGDDGRLWYWEKKDSEWTKNLFDINAQKDIEPPKPFLELASKSGR